MSEFDVNVQRLLGDLKKLATFSSTKLTAPPDDTWTEVTRLVYSEEDMAARDYFAGLCGAVDLAVDVDPIGNMFARWLGEDRDLPPIATGSHIDAIPHAGMYDGTLGVLGGLEAIRSLKESGFRPTRGIDLVLITSEEPTRFGIGCLGSRAMAGTLSAEAMSKLHDADGVTLDQARQFAGFSGPLESIAVDSTRFAAWIELHIEQGRILEDHQTDIGVVTAIAAPATMQVVVEGQGGHAGGVMMADRHDAMMAAAELMLKIESTVRESERGDLVATIGTVDVHPGAVNSIPAKVSFSIDIRDIDLGSRDAAMEIIQEVARQIESTRGVRILVETITADPPALCDSKIVDAVVESAQEGGYSHRRMVSRAYHDSLFMAGIVPMGMIFVPCRGGVSHRPDEYSTPEQIQAGIEVLASTLARLSL
ncbi:MAG: M20 family metallo-hydrolase [Planctomycetota bacterium]